jgi:HEAT repeat protein
MLRAGLVVGLALLVGASGLNAAPQSSFEDQIANLKSPNAKTREQAAKELGKSRRRDAITPLAAMVRDPEAAVRLAVVRSLRELRDLAAVPALLTSMRDGDPRIRREALEGVLEVYVEPEQVWPGYPEVFADTFDEGPAATFADVDPAVFDALKLALRDEEREIRELAAHATGILGGTPIAQELTLSLQDPEARVRTVAATAVGRVGTREQGRLLIPLLSDESARVRTRALHAIGVLGVQEAAPSLRAMSENLKGREFGLLVLQSLSRLGDPQLAPYFRTLLEDPELARRRLAVDGLARIADASLTDAFKKDFQRVRSEEMRLALAFALTRLGDTAFVDTLVLNLSSRSLGPRARRYLLELGPPVLPWLYPYLADPEPEVRAALCDVMAKLGDPDALPRLIPLIQDPSARVADRANRAVERLRRAEAREAAAPATDAR